MTTSSELKPGSQVLPDATPPGPKTYRIGSLVYTKKSLAILFIWLFWGDLCFMLMEQIATGTGGAGLVPLKLKSLHASNWAIGMIMGSIPLGIQMVFNPIISFKSDHFRSRWGRRIPFILGTLPFLVGCLVLVGYGDRIGYALYPWLHTHPITFLGKGFAGWMTSLSADNVALVTFSVALMLFAFFNVFVNSVFWYLFNDVVPEELMGRFIAGFRAVILLKGSIYGFFIFPYAVNHFTEVFLGAAVVYLFGFGAMCLFVKEGAYPPPPPYDGNRKGALAASVTYLKECSGLAHYWYLFIASACLAITWSFGIFGVFFNEAIHLDYNAIGDLAGIGSAAGFAAILVAGYLADRFHPIRVVIGAILMQLLIVTPVNCIWLFWLPSPRVVFWVMALQSIAIGAPFGALMQMYDPPLFMRIFPRDRYGQFCSANVIVRSVTGILFGFLGGLIIDIIKSHTSESIAYRCLPLLNAGAYLLMLVFILMLYRSWKRRGGDEHYTPPLPHGRQADLALENVAAENE